MNNQYHCHRCMSIPPSWCPHRVPLVDPVPETLIHKIPAKVNGPSTIFVSAGEGWRWYYPQFLLAESSNPEVARRSAVDLDDLQDAIHSVGFRLKTFIKDLFESLDGSLEDERWVCLPLIESEVRTDLQNFAAHRQNANDRDSLPRQLPSRDNLFFEHGSGPLDAMTLDVCAYLVKRQRCIAPSRSLQFVPVCGTVPNNIHTIADQIPDDLLRNTVIQGKLNLLVMQEGLLATDIWSHLSTTEAALATSLAALMMATARCSPDLVMGQAKVRPPWMSKNELSTSAALLFSTRFRPARGPDYQGRIFPSEMITRYSLCRGTSTTDDGLERGPQRRRKMSSLKSLLSQAEDKLWQSVSSGLVTPSSEIYEALHTSMASDPDRRNVMRAYGSALEHYLNNFKAELNVLPEDLMIAYVDMEDLIRSLRSAQEVIHLPDGVYGNITIEEVRQFLANTAYVGPDTPASSWHF